MALKGVIMDSTVPSACEMLGIVVYYIHRFMLDDM